MLGDVELQKVSYEMKQNGIGYIKIEEFTETAVDQFCEAAEALEAQNMQALISRSAGQSGRAADFGV